MKDRQRLAASLGGLTTRARHDPKEYTAKARAAFMGRWLKEVDERTPGLPEAERHKRAEALKKAHFRTMVLKRHQGGGCSTQSTTADDFADAQNAGSPTKASRVRRHNTNTTTGGGRIEHTRS